jgi:hypothetical protein
MAGVEIYEGLDGGSREREELTIPSSLMV